MMQSLYTAAAGISGQQTRIDTIAANIANMNTVGYKSAEVGFRDTLYTTMENPEADGRDLNLQRGTGVLADAADRNFSQGGIDPTGGGLDFAIGGSGFFALLGENGTVYTRNGSFSVSPEEDGNYLVSDGGEYVLDTGGNRIRLQDGASGITVSDDGSITDGAGAAVKIGVFEFPNAGGLAALGDSRFSATAASGDARAAENYTVCQGALEGSNVDLAEELTQLMQAQRLFSLASRALQTSDEMEGLAISIRN